MNKHFASLIAFTHKINRQHIQLALVLISLTMLVLGAGAPADGGGIGR
jgi:hypothetical protein